MNHDGTTVEPLTSRGKPHATSHEQLFHLALASQWAAAQRVGEYGWSTRSLRIEDVGFLHASFAHQVEGVYSRFYSDATDDLVLLTLDSDALEARGLKVLVEAWNPQDPTSEAFPHVYGGLLPVDCVSDVRPYPQTDDERAAATR